MFFKSIVVSVCFLVVSAVSLQTVNAQGIGSPTGQVIRVEIAGLGSAYDGTYDVPELDFGRFGGRQYSAPAPFGRIKIINGAFGRGIGVQLERNATLTRTRTFQALDEFGQLVTKTHRLEEPATVNYGTGNVAVTTDTLTTLVMPFGTNNDPKLNGGGPGNCRITKR